MKKTDSICTAKGDPGYINLSDIATRLIQECGRFAEDYASDMLITWDNIRELCGQRYQFPDGMNFIDEIFTFGIRKSGVNHNAFVMNRLFETKSSSGYVFVDHVYRKILAVRVQIFKNHGITASLHNITNCISCIDEGDLDENNGLTPRPYPAGHGIQDIGPTENAMIIGIEHAVFDAGGDAINDVLGFECHYDDKDTIENLLDQVLNQMPEKELKAFYEKYCIKKGGYEYEL